VGHIVGLGLIGRWNRELPWMQRMSIECLTAILNAWDNMQMETKAANKFHEAVDKILLKPGAAELTQDQRNRLKKIVAVIQAKRFQKAMIKGDGQYLYDRIRQGMQEKAPDLWNSGNDEPGLKPNDLARNDRNANRVEKEAGSPLYFRAADYKYASGLNRANPGLFHREVTLFSLLEPGIVARLNILGLRALKRLVKNVSGVRIRTMNRQATRQDRCKCLKSLVIVAIARCNYGDHMELADFDFENDDQRLVGLDFLIKCNVQAAEQASCEWIRRIVTHKKNALPARAPKHKTDYVKATLINASHGNKPTSFRRMIKERNLLVLMARFLQSMPKDDGRGKVLSKAKVILDRHVNGSVWRTAKDGKQVGGAVMYTGPRGGKFVIATCLSTIYVSGPRRQDEYADMRFKVNKAKVAQANEFAQTIRVGSHPEKQRINSEKATR
jgi:hypothetical protein